VLHVEVPSATELTAEERGRWDDLRKISRFNPRVR
jgi:hypothetical protein